MWKISECVVRRARKSAIFSPQHESWLLEDVRRFKIGSYWVEGGLMHVVSRGGLVPDGADSVLPTERPIGATMRHVLL